MSIMHPYLYQKIIATPILLLQFILGIILFICLFQKGHIIKRHFQKYGMIYGLIAGIAALVGSLGFSLGYAYAPCDLCWYQRIFHYPQIAIFAIGLYYRDVRAWTYSIWLSAIGAIIAGYQVLIQFNPHFAESSVCSIVPAAESCSDILVRSYGYISIPVMSLTLFVALITLFLLQKKRNK